MVIKIARSCPRRVQREEAAPERSIGLREVNRSIYRTTAGRLMVFSRLSWNERREIGN